MLNVKAPSAPTVYFSKPNGPVYTLEEVVEVLLIALHLNFKGYRPDGVILDKNRVLRERIPQLLPSMDEKAIAVTMSILTGCGTQVKVRNRWVDRGEFEFDTWAGALGYRDINIRESAGITDEWLKEFTNHGKPLNVMMF